MRPVSNSFLNTVRGPHKAVFRARVVEPWQIGVSPTGTEIPLTQGDVVFDVNSDVNGTLSFKTNLGWDFINPYRHEVFIERGVEYGNGTKEYVGLGYFRVNAVEQDRIRGNPGAVQAGLITVSGEDRKSNLRDARVIAPIQFGSAASVSSVIDFLVQDVMPGVTTVYDTTNWPGGTAATTTLGSDHVLTDDRLKFLEELVAAYGKVCYFDYAGRFVVKDQPSTAGGSVFLINSGQNGILVSADRTISRDGVYNAVVASGEPAGELPPVSAVAYDLDPNSPTVWGGGFGKVPRFFTSSFLTTNGQCQNAAANILQSNKGFPYSVSLGMVPNPALEAWDVVEIRYDNDLSETHIIDSIKYSLSVSDSMDIETRKQYLND